MHLLTYLSADGYWTRAGREPLNPSPDEAWLPGWGVPVWRDEFTGGLSQWNVRNNFLTFDTARAMAANVSVVDEKLRVRANWLTTPLTGSQYPQGIITHDTGYIDTRNLSDSANPSPKHFSQQYGRWEVRCKTPSGPNTRGSLAAFWLRSDNNLGEIDIMEAWGYGGTMAANHTTYIKDSAVTTFHSSTLSSTVNNKPYTKTLFRHWQAGVPRTAWSEFHTYAFEYMPTYIALFVDGIQVMRVTPTSPDPQNAGQTLAWLWDPDFFGSPFHIRLNLHVGPSASFWGLPDPDNRSWTADPMDFLVDYVRVYAPEGA